MKLKSVKKVLVSNALTLATLGGVLVGIILGVCLRHSIYIWTARSQLLGPFARPVIQANGRLIFEDDLRSGGLLGFTKQ